MNDNYRVFLQKKKCIPVSAQKLKTIPISTLPENSVKQNIPVKCSNMTL